jgi:nucleoside-diphosphate kinase
MSEKTFAVIKPDVLSRKLLGKAISKIEELGFNILTMKKYQLSEERAKIFYAEHSTKPFFQELLDDITRGPLVTLVLEGENAIEKWRNAMGATDPQKADAGSLRKEFGVSIGLNSFHGSDSLESAKRELALFFPSFSVK